MAEGLHFEEEDCAGACRASAQLFPSGVSLSHFHHESRLAVDPHQLGLDLAVFSDGIASSAKEQAMIKHVVRCKAPADALVSRQEMRTSGVMRRFI